MSNNLEILAQYHEALLRAEVAAWLHDMGKCADAFLQTDGTGFKAVACQDHPQVNPHKAVFEPNALTLLPYWSGLSPQRGQCSRLEEARHSTALWQTFKNLAVDPTSLDLEIVLPGLGKATIRELVLWGRPLVSDQFQQFRSVLRDLAITVGYLGRAHGAAHIEKEESEGMSSSFVSSPFGFEYARLKDLNSKLQHVILAATSSFQRKDLVAELKVNFDLALGDTRYPENEVTLWDWSSLVAALYKAAMAGALLRHKLTPADLRWRLLSVRLNSTTFLDHVTRMPDLLARQQLLQDGFEKVRVLLEETYPLGTEVYRDESSSLYVTPDLADLMQLTDNNGISIETLIMQVFSQGTVNNDSELAILGEVVPEVKLDNTSWWGQRPDRNTPATNDEVPPINQILQRPINAAADIDAVVKWWNTARDICPVCGLRPQATPNSKAGRRKVCEICERRRDDRAKAWIANLGASTIWLDEVADLNGRVVLLVGHFDLSQWLKGEMIQTLAVNDPNRSNGATSKDICKNPSFSRLRRVWDTTYQFWQDVLPTHPSPNLQQSLVVQVIGQGSFRLTIQGDIRSIRSEHKLGSYHTYELVLADGVRLSVVWDPHHQRFVTVDNLAYVAKLFGDEVPTREAEESLSSHERRKGRWAAETVGSHLMSKMTIEEPASEGVVGGFLGEIVVASGGVGRIISAEGEDITYPPIIPILAEPTTFMALIPASPALTVVQAIKEKYETEMGKVRNRLPLTLGVVYAGRRTPLASVLDAGRRMLRRSNPTVQAEVQELTPQNPLPDGWPSTLDVKMKIDEREIVVGVPTVMGDGTTPDVWYPYWQVAGKLPTDRNRWFVGPDGEYWVHVCDLRVGDRVCFTPSTFDYEYLDASARRFEVAYDSDGQRMGQDRRQRPYLLEQVDDIETTWGEISGLPLSQIKALEALIEAKRRDWGEPIGTLSVSDAFRQLVTDALHESKIHTPALEKAAITGMLADALEIHLTIHKDKSQ